MTRRCECPCRAPLVGLSERAKYVNKTHGQRAYRERVKAEMAAAGLPAAPSLKAARSTSPTSNGNGDPQNQREGRQRPKRSGMQVSFYRAVESVAKRFEAYGSSPKVARERAELTIAEALPARQRERLEARDGR